MEGQKGALTYKDVCGNADRIWFEVGEKKRDRERVMRWIKSLGCTWSNGKEIDPTAACGPYISVHKDGTIAYVNMWAWVAYHMEKEEERTKVVGLEEFDAFVASLTA